MDRDNRFVVENVFHFQDGRTVFAGRCGQDDRLVSRGAFEILIDDEPCGVILINCEMLFAPSDQHGSGKLRALEKNQPFHLNRHDLPTKRFELRPSQERHMHRHLLGMESPPPNYIPDPMTLGPVLPEGWDGDAWARADGIGYYLRAWQAKSGQIAYGRARTYEEARKQLLGEVMSGRRRVEITIQELQDSPAPI